MQRAAAVAAGLLCVALCLANLSFAEDEDTSASVYLVFDEDTGEFITVDDPDRSQMHKETMESIVSGTAQASAATKGATDESGFGVNRSLIGGIVVAIVAALAAGFIWSRRSR